MKKTIDVDFSLLKKDISKLKKIRKQLQEPKMSCKLDLIKTGKDGCGDVNSSIYDFSQTTIEYYKVVSLLLDNTIKFLTNAQTSLKNADQGAAEKLKGEK